MRKEKQCGIVTIRDKKQQIKRQEMFGEGCEQL